MTTVDVQQVRETGRARGLFLFSGFEYQSADIALA
jgi:hypothetical protein